MTKKSSSNTLIGAVLIGGGLLWWLKNQKSTESTSPNGLPYDDNAIAGSTSTASGVDPSTDPGTYAIGHNNNNPPALVFTPEGPQTLPASQAYSYTGKGPLFTTPLSPQALGAGSAAVAQGVNSGFLAFTDATGKAVGGYNYNIGASVNADAATRALSSGAPATRVDFPVASSSAPAVNPGTGYSVQTAPVSAANYSPAPAQTPNYSPVSPAAAIRNSAPQASLNSFVSATGKSVSTSSTTASSGASFKGYSAPTSGASSGQKAAAAKLGYSIK